MPNIPRYLSYQVFNTCKASTQLDDLPSGVESFAQEQFLAQIKTLLTGVRTFSSGIVPLIIDH